MRSALASAPLHPGPHLPLVPQVHASPAWRTTATLAKILGLERGSQPLPSSPLPVPPTPASLVPPTPPALCGGASRPCAPSRNSSESPEPINSRLCPKRDLHPGGRESESKTWGCCLRRPGRRSSHRAPDAPTPALHPLPLTHLNKAFKFSGSSVRPAYPGFMVMKRPTVGIRLIISPRKLNSCFLARMASWTHFT